MLIKFRPLLSEYAVNEPRYNQLSYFWRVHQLESKLKDFLTTEYLNLLRIFRCEF